MSKLFSKTFFIIQKGGTVDLDGKYVSRHGRSIINWTYVSDVRNEAHLEEICQSNYVFQSYSGANCAMHMHKFFRCREYGTRRRQTMTLQQKPCTFKMLFVPWLQNAKSSKRLIGKLFSNGEHNHKLVKRNKNQFFWISINVI